MTRYRIIITAVFMMTQRPRRSGSPPDHGHSSDRGRQAGFIRTRPEDSGRQARACRARRPSREWLEISPGTSNPERCPSTLAEELYKHRRSTHSKDDPTANCIVGGVPRSDLVG